MEGLLLLPSVIREWKNHHNALAFAASHSTVVDMLVTKDAALVNAKQPNGQPLSAREDLSTQRRGPSTTASNQNISVHAPVVGL